MTTLDAEIKTRVRQETKESLEKLAAREDRKPGTLARRYIEQGVARDLEKISRRG